MIKKFTNKLKVLFGISLIAVLAVSSVCMCNAAVDVNENAVNSIIDARIDCLIAKNFIRNNLSEDSAQYSISYAYGKYLNLTYVEFSPRPVDVIPIDSTDVNGRHYILVVVLNHKVVGYKLLNSSVINHLPIV